MKKTKISVAVALVAAASLMGVACSSDAQRPKDTTGSSAAAPTSAHRSPTPAEAKSALASAKLVLDVRTPEEFASGHLERAVNVPVDEVETSVERIKGDVEGDLDASIVVYCAAGGRAGRAKAALEKAGFTRVTNAGAYKDLKD